MVIDVLAFRSAILSISLVSFIVTTFSTTYNTMNDITRAVETCNKDNSITKRDLKKEDVIQFSSRIKTINIIFVVLLFICLLSVLFKPANVDKYDLLAVSFCPSSWEAVRNDSEDVKQEDNYEDSEVSDTEVAKKNVEEMRVFWYFIIVGLMTIASFIMMILLMINVFKLQQLQIRVLKLKTGKAN